MADEAAFTRDYPAEGIVVHWTPSLCQHSGRCFGGLPSVFKPQDRPWVDPQGAPPEDIAAQIDRCPSGALGYSWPEQS